MGRLLDDLDRLNTAAAQGYLLKNGLAETCCREGAVSGAACLDETSLLITKHDSSDFVDVHYTVIRELGCGSFSHVKLVRERRTGHERVCKFVSTEQMSPEVLDLTRMEVKALASLDHPSIVKLYEYADDEAKQMLVLILEYVAGGDCNELLEESGRVLSEARVARLMHQLLIATNCCHAKSIVHRDIKPQNMMLTQAANPWGGPSLKLIDFGLAARMERSRDLVGTPAYIPPEVLRGTTDYTSKVDLWSIACTAFELLAGDPPFGKPEDHDGDMEPVFEKIRQYKTFSDVSAHFGGRSTWLSRSTEAKDFVQRLLQVDPARRPTAIEASCHPWIVRHKPARCGLTMDMVHSMVEYTSAPSLLRSCCFVLAARTDLTEQARVGTAFADVDADENGVISREEFAKALASAASSCGWAAPAMDLGGIFAAIDLSHCGWLSYTEFVAACLYGRYSRSVEQLADQVFSALDPGRIRLVHVSDIAPLFCTEARPYLNSLPQHGPIAAQEWRDFVRRVALEEDGYSDAHSGVPDAESDDEGGPFHFLRFFKMLFCEQAMCTPCEVRSVDRGGGYPDEDASDGVEDGGSNAFPQDTLVLPGGYAYRVV